MDRRTFVTGSLCATLTAAHYQAALTLSAQAPSAAPAVSPVPPNQGADVYAIYSQLLSTRLSTLQTSNRLCLVASQTFAPPPPPVQEAVPPDFSHRMYPIIVPAPNRWYDVQEILADLHRRSKQPIQLEDRFTLPPEARTQQPQNVLLLDAYMQEQFFLSFRQQFFYQKPDGAIAELNPEHRDAALLKRLSGCQDLFRLSPVFFNRAADLALVHVRHLEPNGNGEMWGIYAKTSSDWEPQGSEQGWLIVQPFGTMY